MELWYRNEEDAVRKVLFDGREELKDAKTEHPLTPSRGAIRCVADDNTVFRAKDRAEREVTPAIMLLRFL